MLGWLALCVSLVGAGFGSMAPPQASGWRVLWFDVSSPLLLPLPLLFECIRQELFPPYQFVGQKELIAPCSLHPGKPGVTFVLGGNTGSPSLSVFVGFWFELVEELVLFS